MTRLGIAIALLATTALGGCVTGGPDGGLQASADPRSRAAEQQGGRGSGGPTAMVESIADAQATGLDDFDYLDAGQTFALGAQGRATIAYFESCRVEQIRGGTVTVGTTESRVSGGQLNARTMACKGSRPILVAAAREAGGGVNRAFPPDRWAETSVKNARPIFKWPTSAGTGPHRIVVSQLERNPGQVVWTGSARGSYVTYAGPALTPGLPYLVRVEGGAGEAVFSIDPNLDIADTPVSRVVVIGR
ncbi:MAG: hypothetical protein FJX57_15890 [Alphaproteobacteria bacterium]|nr:hypothetical protein [Alphaproteobacteria bacterium]